MSECDSQSIYNSLLKQILRMDASEGTNGSASFGHLAGGYDSGYYGYLWSEVYSDDMFSSEFKGSKLFDTNSGKKYRREILAVGGSRDAMDSLVKFLGRAPNSEAFLKRKGLL